MQIQWDGRELTFSVARYQNGRPAVLLMSGSYSKYGNFSTNLADLPLAPDEFFVPVWNFDEELVHKALNCGAFQDTGRRAFGDAWSETAEGPEAPVWRIIAPELLAELEATKPQK